MTHHVLQPEPDTLRCSSSTVVMDPIRLTRYEQKMRYGTNEIFGLLPIGYLAMSSGLGLMAGSLSECCHRAECSVSEISRQRSAVRSSASAVQRWKSRPGLEGLIVRFAVFVGDERRSG